MPLLPFWRVAFLFLTGCSLSADLSSLKLSSQIGAPSLIPQSTLFASGSKVPLTTLFGATNLDDFTFSSPDGYYDAAQDAIVFSSDLNSKSSTIIVTSSTGKTQIINVGIDGLDEAFSVDTPLSYGGQNFPMVSAKSATGKFFIGAVFTDASDGWEWTAIYQSSDEGANWEVVDDYRPYIEGESHVLAMASSGSDLYYCGYQYESAGSSKHGWYVRKSSDEGTNWSTVDLIDSTQATSNYTECRALAISPTTGYIYAGGVEYSHSPSFKNWLLRESRDGGATWQTIFTAPYSDIYSSITHLEFSPDNTLWLLGIDSSRQLQLFHGTYTSSWNFSFVSTLGAANQTNYQTFGELLVIDNITAIINSKLDSRWKVLKTTNAGASWTTTYNCNLSNCDAGEIEVLGDGTFIAAGSRVIPGPSTNTITLRSTDNGDTWTPQTLITVESGDGALVFSKSNSSEALMISNSTYHMRQWATTNSGSSWTQGDFIVFWEKFDQYLSDFLVTNSGYYLTTGFIRSVSVNLTNTPFYIGRSDDQGNTWTSPQLLVDETESYNPQRLSKDSFGNIYALVEHGNAFHVRQSQDDGASWNSSDTFIHPTYPANGPTTWKTGPILTVSPSNRVYYTHYFYNTAASAESFALRRSVGGGTGWTTIKEFPLNPTSKSFLIYDIKFTSSGTMFLIGTETLSSNAKELVILSSTDEGENWTEVHRRTDIHSSQRDHQIEVSSSGTFYWASFYGLQKSTDFGATWSTIVSDPIYTLFRQTDQKIYWVDSNYDFRFSTDGGTNITTVSENASVINPANRGNLTSSAFYKLYDLGNGYIGLHCTVGEFRVGVVNLFKRFKLQ